MSEEFLTRVNGDLLYRSPDGREGFVIFDRDKKLVYFGASVDSPPGQAFPVGFTAEALLRIVAMLDE